jgi:hypothetical protein
MSSSHRGDQPEPSRRPERKATHLDAAMQRVTANPPKQPPPSIAGRPMPQQLAVEESNNRVCLQWMHRHLS